MDLSDYRVEIDKIDEQIVELLEERMRVSEKIAEYKKENNLSVTNYQREVELLNKIVEKCSPEFALYGKMLFTTILEVSKDHQRKIAQQEAPVVAEINAALENTPKLLPENAVVACQGVMGAYSEEATNKIFKMPKIMYMKNFEGVFAAINGGLCQYGVLPLENSSAGSVNQVYDLMMEYNFHIVRSLKLQVNHCLLVPHGVKKGEIREIFSHPQALAQCEKYLKQFPMVKVTECENTAAAAKMVAESGRKDVAAIASDKNGVIYDLECLETGIQDTDNNYTRFIVITKNLEIYPGANRTSIMMVVNHTPGSLYNVLARFNAMGINLVKLESRPIPARDFEFMFYFDIQESVYSQEFVRMMNQLEGMSREFKYLGSYIEE